jgi:hypothetical protein
MTEPSVNDLSAMSLPGGKEMEPVVLIDTTGSMSYKAEEGGHVTRWEVLSEAMGSVVAALQGTDSQAGHEEEGGGVMAVTFAGGGAEVIGDLNSRNFRDKWRRIRIGGGTQLMPGLSAVLDNFAEEFPDANDRPGLFLLAITDGEAEDTAAFAAKLELLPADEACVVLAIMGYGDEHDAALRAYQDVARRNKAVRVVTFDSVTDPSVISSAMLSLMGK